MANKIKVATLGGAPAGRPVEDFSKKLVRTLERYPPLVVLSMLVLITIIGVALFAPEIAPFEYSKMDLRARLQAPVWMTGGTVEHLLGTHRTS